MEKILQDLEELRHYSGNTQITLLHCKKNDLLKEVLEYTYNSHKKYKIDEGKFDKIVVNTSGTNPKLTVEDWHSFTAFLDELIELKSAKDEHVKAIKQFIYSFRDSDFLKMVLFKDLRLGMNTKKFQKVWPDFCVEPQVQLAEKFEGKSFIKNRYSRKLDGLRCYYLDGVPISRTNKKHKEAPFAHITQQIKSHLDYKTYVLDGEIIYLNPDGTENFAKAISLARSDDRTPECDNLYFCIFDMIPKDKFLAKEPDCCFDEAYTRLLAHYRGQGESVAWYNGVDANILILKQVDDTGLQELQDARFKNNWEGLMLRDGDSPYQYKRTNKLLKIKEMQDTEVKLVSMEEGTGKFVGTLGAFIADYNGFPLKIGSGFSDEQRAEYWNNRDKYIGHYVKVKYFEKTTNQQGGESLRFPIFLCFRHIDTMEEFLTL